MAGQLNVHRRHGLRSRTDLRPSLCTGRTGCRRNAIQPWPRDPGKLPAVSERSGDGVTRVLLINPPSPERLGAPLLGFQYVAAALLARGCEVKVIDAAARYFHPDAEWITREAAAFRPDIIGFALFTRWVWHAYRLVEQLHLPNAL